MHSIVSVPDFVEFAVQKHMLIWNNSISEYDELDLTEFMPSVEESEVDKALDELAIKLKNNNGDIPDKETFKKLFVKILNCDPGIILSDDYKKSTHGFLRKAREFDPEITINELYQAIRNLWIANSIQHLFGMEVKLSDPLFAYSMLYPYTDNLLDNSGINNLQKQEFNARFRKRLNGEQLKPGFKLEATIFHLVSFIEAHYSREDFSGVYESLLAIHTGQEKSILLLNGNGCTSYEVTAEITFEKGGTSVLADGFLVSGNLSHEKAEFLMGYGIFLQLLDDLQDLQDDYVHHQHTIFTHWMCRGDMMDKPAVQMMDFMLKVIMQGEVLFPEKSNFFKVIRNSCLALANRSIHKNKMFFSNDFINFMEKKTGFSSEFFSNQEKRFKSIDRNVVESYFNSVMSKEILQDL
jgi:hypothetical protein